MNNYSTKSSQHSLGRNHLEKFTDHSKILKPIKNEFNFDRLAFIIDNGIKNFQSSTEVNVLTSKKLNFLFHKPESSIQPSGDLNRVLSNPNISNNIKTKLSDIYLKTVGDVRDSVNSKKSTQKTENIVTNIKLPKEINQMNSKIFSF
jgi:hypothetical protein